VIDFLPNKGRVFIDYLKNDTARAYAKGLYGDLPYRIGLTGGIISCRGLEKQFLHRDEIAIPPEHVLPADVAQYHPVPERFRGRDGRRAYWTGISPSAAALGCAGRRSDAALACCRGVRRRDHVGRPHMARGGQSSDKTRYALSTWYSMAGITPDQIYIASLHDDIYDTLSTEERELLGFRVHSNDTYINKIAPRSSNDRQRNTNLSIPYVPELHRNRS